MSRIPASVGMRTGRAGVTTGLGRQVCHSLFFLFVVLSACAPDSSAVVIHPENGAPVTVRVEVADTDETRQLGLMYRNELPASAGMLFVFPHERPRSFWMKNTPLPLDIVYIGDDLRIVHIAERTTPYSTAPLPSLRPAKFVLEVNAGFCDERDIRVGDRIELRGVASPLL